MFDAAHQQARRHEAFVAEAAEAGVEIGEMQPAYDALFYELYPTLGQLWPQ